MKGLLPAHNVCIVLQLPVRSVTWPTLLAVPLLALKTSCADRSCNDVVLTRFLQVLFTVVSRDEKYSAKLVIDTVVQRLGDALAAAAFQILGERRLLLASAVVRAV
jgi:hypothetical protein